MRAGIKPVLSDIGACATLAIAACVPFILIGAISNGVAHAGLHIDAAYTGGDIARTLEHSGYQIVVYRPVRPHALQRIDPFVQIVFKPAPALPAHIDEQIDLDGDGKPDVRVSFDVPADPRTPLRGDVIALNAQYVTLSNVGGNSFSELLVRTGNQIVVRVPTRSNGGDRF